MDLIRSFGLLSSSYYNQDTIQVLQVSNLRDLSNAIVVFVDHILMMDAKLKK